MMRVKKLRKQGYKMFRNHIYADSKEDALSKTQSQYPHHTIGDVYLDEVWQNPNRWCIDVYFDHRLSKV